MSYHQSLNTKWIAAAERGLPPANEAADYGVTIHQAGAGGSQKWTNLGAYHLLPEQNKGNHHIYCDVLNIDKTRRYGARLELRTEYNYVTHAVVDKPWSEAGTNFPLYDYGNASIRVIDPNGTPSDVVAGLHFRHNDEGQHKWNSWGHHSFYICFMLMSAPKPKPPIVTPPTKPDQPALTWFDFSGKAAIQGDEVLLRFNWQDIKDEQQTNALRFIR